ncbi:hypothetical protein ABT095_33760 [Kitasatospora sp. NPDC002227]|uniref:hypothetical protein n=1 Tax=Kitasatospora sp. NPDC002227 TaxID=3154773 RepID=UPI00331EE810
MTAASLLALYARCPACDLVGPPESADYAVTPDSTVDWTSPRGPEIRCGECGHLHTITEDDVLAFDAEHACTRCQHATACPASAARVQCGECGLVGFGPASSNEVLRALTTDTEQLRRLQQRQQIQTVKALAGLTATRTGRAER